MAAATTALSRPRPPMSVQVSTASLVAADIPRLSAIFLILFDTKIGYTVAWQRSLPGVEIDGVVEFKSLPSGLHLVREDLIYFVHGTHAGLSAFVNVPAGSASRNARMLAVGVLVPLSYGRLGRSWKHADALKELAQLLANEPNDTDVLERYWAKYKVDAESQASWPSSPVESPAELQFKPIRSAGKLKASARARSTSDGHALLSGQRLSDHHPALSLPDMLETFGPLVFPIYRAALLRKRILLAGHAPVQQLCDFVYNISILSNLPVAISELLADEAPPQRLKPLFTIGIHDIPFLEDDLRASKEPAADDARLDEMGWGWVACTTDGILTTKKHLFDVLITMPPTYSKDAESKAWPKVETSRGTPVKATQRDLRRYQALRLGLARLDEGGEDPSTPHRASTDSRPRSQGTLCEPESYIRDTDSIAEPVTWSALAYSGFMWWASAGEQRHFMDSERAADEALLADLEREARATTPRMRSRAVSNATVAALPQQRELMLIAYFHRLTTLLLSSVSNAIDTMSDDDELSDGDTAGLLAHPQHHAGYGNADDEPDAATTSPRGPPVVITSDDIVHMGLDVWSPADHRFVGAVVRAYFGRRAVIEGRSIDICGIRIC